MGVSTGAGVAVAVGASATGAALATGATATGVAVAVWICTTGVGVKVGKGVRVGVGEGSGWPPQALRRSSASQVRSSIDRFESLFPLFLIFVEFLINVMNAYNPF